MWFRLPKQWWPASWRGKLYDSIVKLRIVLCGHPELGVLLEKYLGKVLTGLRRVLPGFMAASLNKRHRGRLRRRPCDDCADFERGYFMAPTGA
eukprot:745657-Heterocapsa_arctica.AAC.1